MATNTDKTAPQRLPWTLLRAGGRHGLPDSEQRDPIGLAVAALNRLASSELVDRLGLRKASEQTVYRVTSAGSAPPAPSGASSPAPARPRAATASRPRAAPGSST